MFATTPFSKTRSLNGNGIAPRSLGKPAAAFPGAIATDQKLAIAVDRQQTTLASQVNTGDTVMTVSSAALIVLNSLLSIDNEIVQVTGITGTQITITRGFDGTTPTIHLAGATVSGFIDAYHHNTLVAEIEAIENALGANLSKVPGTIYLSVPAFNFAPQSPGGSLTTGNNVVTLSPVPSGVNGTDANHYLYISGGTGTAEAVLITGGTATEGATSGTVIVNCANAHSGAWTIASATVGCAEAVQHGQALYPGGFLAWMGAGTVHFYAPVRISGNGVKIRGQGSNSTFIDIPANTAAFQFFAGSGGGYFNSLSDLAIAAAASTSGYGIDTTGGQSNFSIERVLVQSCYHGIRLNNIVEGVVRDVNVTYVGGGNGVVIDGANGNALLLNNVIVQSNQTFNCGFFVGEMGNCLMVNCSSLLATNGIEIAPPAGAATSVDCHLCYFDQSSYAGVLLQPAASVGLSRCSFHQCWMSSGGYGVSFEPTTGRIRGIQFIGCQISQNSNNGINFAAGTSVDGIEVIGCTLSNNKNGIAVDTSLPVFVLRVEGCSIGNNFDDWGTGPQVTGVYMGPAGNLVCIGNTFSGNTTGPIALPAASQNQVIANNAGIDDVVPTVASAASIQLPVNPVLNVTGTTTITTLTSYWTGRRLTLIKTDAGSLTVGGGGNIPVAHTLAQNGSLVLTSTGGNWY